MERWRKSYGVIRPVSGLAVLVAVLMLVASLTLAAGDGTGRGEEGAVTDAAAESAEEQAAGRLTLPGGEVTLEYPADYSLAATPQQLAALSMSPACSEPFDYCIYLPESASAGTNLSGAGLRVARRPDLTAEISCLLAQPAGWSDLQPGVLRLPAASTSRFGDLGEGAAGSYSQGEVRRLWTGQNCYEFESRLVLTRFENYPPGAVQEFTSVQQAALGQELLGITEAATLSDGRPIEWPLAKRSSLRAFVRVDSPGIGASFRSPLLIRGQAVGPWFFEGSFPVELVAADGTVLASHYVMADGEWMTTDFVPFGGELEFEVTEPTEAVLVLRRDNPSGLPEHDAVVKLSVQLLPD